MNATVYRAELPPLTERIARLPVHRGYPVPWFVGWLDSSGAAVARGEGEPDFRVIYPDALDRAYFDSLCWICGEPRGRYASFVAGPMCAVNRTSSEPPSHPECAGWSACACPFLTRPHARRREAGLPGGLDKPAGIALLRNPGVALCWSSRDWRRWVPPGGGYLYYLGTPEDVVWYAEGRVATRAEILHSIETGLPALTGFAAKQGVDALAELDRRMHEVITELVPPA